jgi:hypothetical protein
MDKPDARPTDFGSAEDFAEKAKSHTQWFQAKVERALADSRPTIPHDQVITEVRAAIAAAAQPKTLT